MKNASRKFLIVPLVALALLAACSREHNAPAVATARVAAAQIVARGRIAVEGGSLQLAMPVEGTIAEVGVHEGDKVRRGALLVALDPATARIDRDLARAHLDDAQAQVKLAQTRAQAAQTRAGRLAQAAQQDAGDAQSADDARAAAAEAAAELDKARAAVRIARADGARAAYVLSQLTLRAPTDAEVLRVTAWPGMHVSPQGGSLVSLLPDAARIVRAELTEPYVAEVAPGGKAEILSDDGRLTPLGTAHVSRIGPTFGVSQLQDDSERRLDERSVEVVLAFDETTTLRVGRRVLVRFSARDGNR